MLGALATNIERSSLCGAALALALVACRPTGEGSQASSDTGRAGPAAASTAVDDSTRFTNPVDLIREYTRRDGAGQRLRADSWFAAVATWEDEPGWDEFTVVRSYEVRPARTHGDSATVDVLYRRLGRVTQSGGGPMHFEQDTGTDSVAFRLVRRSGDWKIIEPQINQHVLADSVLKKVTLPDSSRSAIERLGPERR